MGLEPPPEVRQVLQTHPGDPRFQFRSETDQGGLTGEPRFPSGTTGLLAPGVGAALAQGINGCRLWGLAKQARRFSKGPGSGSPKIALIIPTAELMVGEGCTQGPRDYLFRTEGLVNDYRPWPRIGAGEI